MWTRAILATSFGSVARTKQGKKHFADEGTFILAYRAKRYIEKPPPSTRRYSVFVFVLLCDPSALERSFCVSCCFLDTHTTMLDFDSLVGGKEPAFDDEVDVDLARLAANDRDAIMARVTPDESVPSDAFALAQNEIRREVTCEGFVCSCRRYCSRISQGADHCCTSA